MRIKYPRTNHLPFSMGVTSDDKVLKNTSHFEGELVIVTEKMDGENTNIYTDGFHARSIDSKHHSSRDWIAKIQSEIGYRIPEGWRICGENLFAKHSIEYADLPSYFLAFSVWNEDNICLSWEETKKFLVELDLNHPKVLYEGMWDEKKIKGLVKELDLERQEGFVVRKASSFKYEDFSNSVAKFVRKNHVNTSEHWMHQKITPNKLKP